MPTPLRDVCRVVGCALLFPFNKIIYLFSDTQPPQPSVPMLRAIISGAVGIRASCAASRRRSRVRRPRSSSFEGRHEHKLRRKDNDERICPFTSLPFEVVRVLLLFYIVSCSPDFPLRRSCNCTLLSILYPTRSCIPCCCCCSVLLCAWSTLLRLLLVVLY
jgi:hypothetical protein